MISIHYRGDSLLIMENGDVRVWENIEEEKIINKFLAQGYEVKQIIDTGNGGTTVYFEKDV